MLKILCENTFEESIWCQKIYEGLICELKKRRIAYEKVWSIDSVLCTDSVYIIGSSHIWINWHTGDITVYALIHWLL